MKDDYSDVVLSQGLVCMNTNNHAYCIVIDGHQGSDANDRCSLVLEFSGDTFILNTPPNRALKPTGQIKDLKKLRETLDKYVYYT